MIKLYGIPNCDTVKKARSWLAENGIEFEFVDFKKNSPTADLIDGWLNQADLEILLNKRGTTWRKLDKDAQESAATKEGAIRPSEKASLEKIRYNTRFEPVFRILRFLRQHFPAAAPNFSFG